MVKSRDEILEIIRGRIGDDNSDEALSFIEDITDTVNDYESRLADSTDWKTKYEENDKNWRERYKERFFSNEIDETEITTNEVVDETPTTYEELFEVKE